MSAFTSLGPLFDAPLEDPSVHIAAAAKRHGDDGRWLDALRNELVRMYEHRVASWSVAKGPAYVTADDARCLIAQYPYMAPPPGVSNNALGAVFRGHGWVRIGDHFSTTVGSHGNRVGKYSRVAA